ELDARGGIPFRDKAYFYFRLQGRVILPVGGDVPGEHQPRRRFPHQHAAPVARAAVIATLIPAAAHPWLADSLHSVGLADLVHPQRPPRPHLFGENMPGHQWRRLHVNDLSDAVRVGSMRFDLFGHHELRTFLAVRSAASLKAPSVSSQNPSSHRRIASTPRMS